MRRFLDVVPVGVDLHFLLLLEAFFSRHITSSPLKFTLNAYENVENFERPLMIFLTKHDLTNASSILSLQSSQLYAYTRRSREVRLGQDDFVQTL